MWNAIPDQDIPISFGCKTVNIKLLTIVIFRCIVGLVGFTTMVFAAQLLPLFIALIIFNTSPFWTAALSYWILGDRLTGTEAICMVGCFIGVIVLAMGKRAN